MTSFKCPCDSNRTIFDSKGLSRHVQYNHYNNEGDFFLCVLPDCNKPKIRGQQNILRHFKNNHLFDKRLAFLADEFIFIQSESDNNNINNINNINNNINNTNDESYSMNSFGSSEMEFSIEPPTLLNPILNNIPLNLEDKFCQLVVNQKKRYKTTEVAALNIAQDWYNFYSDIFGIGNFLIKKNFI